MKKKVIIIGASGFAKEAWGFVNKDRYEVLGFLDSNPKLHGSQLCGLTILGDDSLLKDLMANGLDYCFIAIGNPRVRQKIALNVKSVGLKLLNLIHPSAVIAETVIIGEGCIIYPNVTINTDGKIGDCVLINSNVSIGHDITVGDCVNINPGANVAGNVNIDQGSFLGIGCNVLENISIDSGITVGGGALVNKDLNEQGIYVGVPAKRVK